jgi:hypothetical protein
MKKLFSIAFAVITLSANGQSTIDLLTLSGRYGMPSSYNAPPPGYTGTPIDGEKATETGVFINAKAPIKFSEKTIWFNNLSYTSSNVTNAIDFPATMQNPIGLHGFILQTGLVQRIDEKRAFQLLYVPRYMTDDVSKSEGAWQHGAIALYEYRWSSNFMMRFGAMYNQEKAGPLLVPLFDINWQMSKKWSMFGLFPIYLKVNYQANERWAVGLSHFGLITSYALHNENYSGDYMERTSIDLTGFARWKMAGNWHLEGRVGYALGRNYEQYHPDQKIDFRLSILKFGDNRGEPQNVTFSDGPIAELRLVYALPLPK